MLILPLLINSANDLFRDIIPASIEVSIIKGISYILFSLITFAIAGLLKSISHAGTTPLLSLSINLWEITPTREAASCALI